jgi:hypothetical protein
MKAERLDRKTHLRKITVNPFTEAQFYDLTQELEQDFENKEVFDLKELYDFRETNPEKIEELPTSFDSAADILLWCSSLISESPLSRSLWLDAQKNGWKVGISNLNSDGFYLDIKNKKLFLDYFMLTPSSIGRSAYFRCALITTLIRALRDIWHENRLGPFEEEYSPEDVLMLERVRAADCDTCTILASWELRGAGYGEIWRHLLGTEEGDMAIVFTRVLERDPTALFDGAALAYAFRQWYAHSTRVDGCDHETLEVLDDILLDGGIDNPFGKKRIDHEIIEILSELPDGTLYLDGMSHVIINDPFFSGLKDEINQTHLFHLMYDLEVKMVENVPFRDHKLAKKIFPEEQAPIN